MPSLHDIAREKYSHDPVTKPLRYYEIYEQALHDEGLAPKTILEIGVYQGESTKTLATRFPTAHIVALDLNLKEIDFSRHGNVHYLKCDQADSITLKSILNEHFPDGVDLVIEDASHIGHLSRLTFNCVFPYVSSGGLYIVEDWGTGYWETWIDGEQFTECEVPASVERIAKRISSHQSGMVGFVKSLVDYTAVDDIASDRAVAATSAARLVLAAGRFPSLRKVAERMPRLKTWLTRILDARSGTTASAASSTRTDLPRLRSLKLFRGVCIACKA